MSSPNQPAFWLQVKKEYVLENFDSLLYYLRMYEYSAVAGGNPDFDSTLGCMEDLCHEFEEVLDATPFYEELKFSRDMMLIIRLFCATILAARKAGRQPHGLILALGRLLLKSNFTIDMSLLPAYYNNILNCIRRKTVLSAGFNWGDLMDAGHSVEMIVIKYSKMIFAPDNSKSTSLYYENHGLLVIPPDGGASLALMNLMAFRRSESNTILKVPGFLDLKVGRNEYEKNLDFAKLYKFSANLSSAQRQIKPSPERQLRVYDMEDEFIVKVISKFGNRIEAETVDPNFEKIRGMVFLNSFDRRPIMRVFSDCITEGCYLKVMLSTTSPFKFETADSFETFYRDEVVKYAGRRVRAAYVAQHAHGVDLMTEDGIRICLHNEIIDNAGEAQLKALERAKTMGLAIYVRLYTNPPRVDDDRFNVYCSFLPNEDYALVDESDQLSVSDGEYEIVNYFIEEASNDLRIPQRESIKMSYDEMDIKDCESLIPLVYRVYNTDACSTLERAEELCCLKMLCTMTEHEHESAYVDHTRHFIAAEVDFAHNREVKPLPKPELIEDLEEVKRRERIISILRSYRKKDVTTALRSGDVDFKNEEEEVDALVAASNSLLNIIDDTELNNIKQSITRALDVEDEFLSILDERTFYGIESISLEFKMSIVFPPTNRRRLASVVADPDLQKWAIIAAVCGFMNTRYGGEVLLGVRDTGFAEGLESDFYELFKRRLISVPDIDHYRIYVNGVLDYAFKEYQGKGADTDIARTCIELMEETNAEGKTILRIKVKPYEKNVVVLAAGPEDRPENVASAYLRKSGRTVPVTSAIRKEIQKYKKSADSADS